jgi:hypothetical protein
MVWLERLAAPPPTVPCARAQGAATALASIADINNRRVFMLFTSYWLTCPNPSAANCRDRLGTPATTNRPRSQNRILTIDEGRFIVRRARLAPAMISTPGHWASRRRQREALPAWSLYRLGKRRGRQRSRRVHVNLAASHTTGGPSFRPARHVTRQNLLAVAVVAPQEVSGDGKPGFRGR